MTKASRGQPPQRLFAFIRGINVGGRRLTNDQLMAPFVRLGFSDVAAYQAAGNITFCSDDPEHVRAEQLEAAVSDAYRFNTPVFLRSHAELSAIQRAQPFRAEELTETEGRVQVSFLHAAPGKAAVAQARALVPPGERIVFLDREWFWLPARGISHSKLPVAAIEDLVGPMTMRTLGTVSRMLSRFS